MAKVWSKNGWLYLHFNCYGPDGSKLRCREATKLTDNNKNRKIVESKRNAIEYEIKHGRFEYLHFFPSGAKAHLFKATPEDVLFSDWWGTWLSGKSIRENTERGWSSSYKTHIGPYFGHFLLRDITEDEILVFRKLLEQKLKPNSINDKVMKPLRMCLRKAYKRGLIDHYPCEEIKRLTEPTVDIDPFSFEELEKFLTFLKTYRNPMYYDLVFIWSRTGPRPGELYAFKWRFVDYSNTKLMVRETRLPSGREGLPKTKYSARDIDLRPAVIEALKRQEARTGLMDSYLFMTEANKPFSDAFMRKKFRHLQRLAGLKYRAPGQLRHTFATLHIAAGENISWVSKMLGHSSVEITLKKYNRFIPNLTRDDGSAFEKIVDQKTPKGHSGVTSAGK